MALSHLGYSKAEYEAVSSKISWASNAITAGASDELLLAFHSVGKGSGTLPAFSSVTNNKGLTFTRRTGGKSGVAAGVETAIEYWWARVPALTSGLVATFNWSLAVPGDKGSVVLQRIGGVQDWANPFGGNAGVSFINNGAGSPWPSRSVTKTVTEAFKVFYWFSQYINSGAPNTPNTLFNNTTPSSYFRHALGYEHSSNPTFTGTYSGANTYSAHVMGDVINGDPPASQSQSRPIVVLTG